jgi:hypothetical protein
VLDGTDGSVIENRDMIKVALDYCKNLFGYETRPKIRLKPDFFSNEEKVNAEENEMLGQYVY